MKNPAHSLCFSDTSCHCSRCRQETLKISQQFNKYRMQQGAEYYLVIMTGPQVFQKRCPNSLSKMCVCVLGKTFAVHSPWIKKYQVLTRWISIGNNSVVPVEVFVTGFLILWVLFWLCLHAIAS